MANLLTCLRLLLAIPVAMAFARPELISAPALLALVVLAIGSDYFDGWIARRTNTATARGMLFDHCADVTFVVAGLSGIAVGGLISPFLPALVGVAFVHYVCDSYYLYRDRQLRVSTLGRWNGILYFLPLLIVALSRLEATADVRELLEQAVMILGYLLIFSTLASIVDRAIAPLRTP